MKRPILILVFLFSIGCEHEIIRVDEAITVTIIAEQHNEGHYPGFYSFYDNTGSLGFMWPFGKELVMEYDSTVNIVLEGVVLFGTPKVDTGKVINDTLITDHDTTFFFKVW